MVALSKARIYFGELSFETNILPKIKSSNPDLLVVTLVQEPQAWKITMKNVRALILLWTSPLGIKDRRRVYRSLALASPEGVEVYNYQVC